MLQISCFHQNSYELNIAVPLALVNMERDKLLMEYLIKELLFKAYSAGSEGKFLPVSCLLSMSCQGEGTVKKKKLKLFF